MKTIDQFICDNNIKFTDESPRQIRDNPNLIDNNNEWCKTATHWECTMIKTNSVQHNVHGRLPDDRSNFRTLRVFFSQGSKNVSPPTLANVLNDLVSDIVSVKETDNIIDWAIEYGYACPKYEKVSNEAEQIYQIINNQANRLLAFLGSVTYNDLLWKTISL